MVWDEIFTVGL